VIECFWISQRGSEPIFGVSPYQSAILATESSNKITHAIVHLLNFPTFFGPYDFVHRYSGGWIRRGRVLLDAEGWRVTIDENEFSKSRLDFVKEKGSYAITHAARIERVDGSPFTSEMLEEQLLVLHIFLSFALGRWSGLFMPVGYDAEGGVVYREWGSRMESPGTWQAHACWIDAHNSDILSEVYPGFCRLQTHPLWKAKLHEVLWWYVGSNNRGPTVSIDWRSFSRMPR
jgi:hypothetical protein